MCDMFAMSCICYVIKILGKKELVEFQDFRDRLILINFRTKIFLSDCFK